MTPPSVRAAAPPRPAARIAVPSILLFLPASPAASAEAGARAGLSCAFDSDPLKLSSGEPSGSCTGTGVAAGGEERARLTSRRRASLRIEAGSRWHVIAGHRAGDRSDRHAGHDGSRGRGVVLSASWEAGKWASLRASISTRSLGYPHDSVSKDPAGETRRSNTTGCIGRIERRISSRVGAYATAGAERCDSNDPAWEHRRSRVQAGAPMGAGP